MRWSVSMGPEMDRDCRFTHKSACSDATSRHDAIQKGPEFSIVYVDLSSML